MRCRSTLHILPCIDIRDIRTRVRFINDSQFHACDAFRKFGQPLVRFPQKIGRQVYIFPDLRFPYPADFLYRCLIKYIILAVIHRSNVNPPVSFRFIAFIVCFPDLRPKRDKGRGTFRMVGVYLHIGEVLPKLHCLERGFAEIRKVIKHFAIRGVSQTKISSMSTQELLPDCIHRHGIIRTAVMHIIVIIGDCHIPNR